MDLGDVGGVAWSWDTPTAVTTAIDLWEHTPDTLTLYGRVGGISLMQTTDLGDAQHEILLFRYVWGNTTGGSGGGTPVSKGVGYGAANTGHDDTLVECRNTTAASGGTPELGLVHGWNVLQPTDIWYPNGLEVRYGPGVGGGELNVVRFLAAPADSITMTSNIFLRNLGYR